MKIVMVFVLLLVSSISWGKPLKGMGVDLISTLDKETGREELVLKSLFKCVGREYTMA